MRNQILCLILICLCTITVCTANTIQGKITSLAGTTITLTGIAGNSNYPIAHATISNSGDFTLHFGQQDYGIAYLTSIDNKTLVLILADEKIILTAEDYYPESVVISQGNQNLILQQYAKEYPVRDNALSAWAFLDRMYKNTSIVKTQKKSINSILKEKNKIVKAENDFIKKIDTDSYVRWYIPMRKLASSVYAIAQNRPEDISVLIKEFRKLDYTDPRWNKSDLYTDIFEKHFWLLENSGGNLDSVYNRMKISLDIIFANLANDEKKYNEIGNFLFDLLEKRSLFAASEYMALKLLSQNRCTLDENFAKELETYRIMRTGNIAPDITFTENTLAAAYPPAQYPTSLYDLKSDYKLVIFGAGWCNSCIEELPKIASMYNMLKENNIEVVYISLDTDAQSFINFAGKFPFISTSDFKGWNSPIAEAYYVSATPTMFLLDKDNKILLRPNSAKHLDAWIEWYIK